MLSLCCVGVEGRRLKTPRAAGRGTKTQLATSQGKQGWYAGAGLYLPGFSARARPPLHALARCVGKRHWCVGATAVHPQPIPCTETLLAVTAVFPSLKTRTAVLLSAKSATACVNAARPPLMKISTTGRST